MKKRIKELQERIVNCRKCPRLVEWCEKVSKEKVSRFAEDDYWGGPVPSFGDPMAQLLVVGLAPGAHGANRTGRMFTGDRSGDWLYRALHRAGFANQSLSKNRRDGLKLKNAWISAIIHCAPPLNKPTTSERDSCLPYLSEELDALGNVSVILALGSFAWDGVLRSFLSRGEGISPKPKFGHGSEAALGRFTLIASYHPSQQNTFTGRLTEEMLDSVFEKVRHLTRRT